MAVDPRPYGLSVHAVKPGDGKRRKTDHFLSNSLLTVSLYHIR